MLTYITVQEFLDIKDSTKTGIVTANTDSDGKILSYLKKATRYIERYTRRRFFPYIERQEYPVPYAALDLRVRRFPSAHMKLNQDLLETITVNNGVQDLEPDDYYLLEHNVYPKTIIGVRFPNYWGGMYGGGSYYKRYDEAVVYVTGIWGYADFDYPRNNWINTGETVPIGGIDATQTTLSLINTDGEDENGETRFLVGKMVRINNEFMEVNAVNNTTNVITVKRGIHGSTASTHESGDIIYTWRVVDDIREVTYQIAKLWREAGIATGGRIGVSDVSVGAELGIPNDPLMIMKSYQRSLV